MKPLKLVLIIIFSNYSSFISNLILFSLTNSSEYACKDDSSFSSFRKKENFFIDYKQIRSCEFYNATSQTSFFFDKLYTSFSKFSTSFSNFTNYVNETYMIMMKLNMNKELKSINYDLHKDKGKNIEEHVNYIIHNCGIIFIMDNFNKNNSNLNRIHKRYVNNILIYNNTATNQSISYKPVFLPYQSLSYVYMMKNKITNYIYDFYNVFSKKQEITFFTWMF